MWLDRAWNESATELRVRALRFRQHASLLSEDGVAVKLIVIAEHLEARALLIERTERPRSTTGTKVPI
jgi:hypothetical protein